MYFEKYGHYLVSQESTGTDTDHEQTTVGSGGTVTATTTGNSSPVAVGPHRRTAKTLRLTVRRRLPGNVRAYEMRRESRSVAMPGIFHDVRVGVKERAIVVVDRALMPLFRKIVSGWVGGSGEVNGSAVGGDGFDLSLVNVAAVELRKVESSQKTLASFFKGVSTPSMSSSGSSLQSKESLMDGASRDHFVPRTAVEVSNSGASEKGLAARLGIDWTVLMELPDDIRKEILSAKVKQDVSSTSVQVDAGAGLSVSNASNSNLMRGTERGGKGGDNGGKRKRGGTDGTVANRDGPLKRLWGGR
ncbi:hypothetical protein HDU76_008996 [Blyttiomyces sp. JEL0837]|nr:hypothetical protein HDU76_008996 [Blyttiomyces sp. JEL0837]